jgi:hypothetical protein
MSDLEIRPAKLADLDAVLAMIERDSLAAQREDPASRADYLKAFEEIQASSHDELIVATLGGHVAAAGSCSWRPTSTVRMLSDSIGRDVP